MVHIITDSAADLEPREYEKLKITCIPLTVMFGDREFQENVDLGKDRFYELLLESDGFPKTSQPAPQVLEELFETMTENGDEAVYITLSSGLSGTYQTARMIRDLVDRPSCYVVDSLNATGGQRLVLEHAARLRDEGKSAAEIVAAVEELRGRIVLFACLHTLEYLHKGGRISHLAYTLGNLAQIKPIITVDPEGKVGVPAKVMGMRKGMDWMCKKVAARKPDGGHRLYVMYTNNRAAAETLAQRLEGYGYAIPEERVIQVGAAIGAHIGPDACGLVYVGE